MFEFKGLRINSGQTDETNFIKSYLYSKLSLSGSRNGQGSNKERTEDINPPNICIPRLR